MIPLGRSVDITVLMLTVSVVMIMLRFSTNRVSVMRAMTTGCIRRVTMHASVGLMQLCDGKVWIRGCLRVWVG